MYQLTDADFKTITAWFHGDVPSKNGVTILDVIKTLSDANQTPPVQTIADEPVVTTE